ncbi:uncharacterized protein J8A68_004486 [[Candida] subhashii]|uniref:Uncharacterized protein n=1 Tax=[Candida] subhashii TaxID=561895 RepID=A0A8J5QB26_9ASCO|nr:uncharacterized protein J8A68_004486 [[Candida] subhashii]KAG7661986.1 hypothetical protein J8A68_004486 [[Candida] subhashii]
MFKQSFASYLIPQWFKRSPTTESSPLTAGASNAPIPKSFTISNPDNKLISISMKEHNNDDLDFIDIQSKELSYAEVASLAKNKKQTTLKQKTNLPSPGRTTTNQFNALNTDVNDELLDDHETNEDTTLKSDYEYQKSRNFRSKQFETVQKKKQRNADYKAKMKQEASS